MIFASFTSVIALGCGLILSRLLVVSQKQAARFLATNQPFRKILAFPGWIIHTRCAQGQGLFLIKER
jgi:hypothetical protein